MSTKNDASRERILEHVLVLRCQAGDRKAFTRLYIDHHERLRGYLMQLIDRADVEDVLQEVWLTVYRSISQLSNPAGFRMWLFRVARSRALDALRRAGRYQAMLEHAAQAEPRSRPQEGHREKGDTGLTDALTKLSVEHREVLQLRFEEDLPYSEIAAVVGCPIGTVRSRLHQAKAALRDALESQGLTHSRLWQGGLE